MIKECVTAWPAMLGVGLLALGLVSCAAPPPPAPATVAEAPGIQMARLLQQAQAEGYAEGLAAGKRIQARKDRELAAAKTQAAPAPAVAEATPPPSPPPAAAEPPPADGFAPQGPAVPLMSPNAGGI